MEVNEECDMLLMAYVESHETKQIEAWFLTTDVSTICVVVEICSQTWIRVLFIQLSWETITE